MKICFRDSFQIILLQFIQNIYEKNIPRFIFYSINFDYYFL